MTKSEWASWFEVLSTFLAIVGTAWVSVHVTNVQLRASHVRDAALRSEEIAGLARIIGRVAEIAHEIGLQFGHSYMNSNVQCEGARRICDTHLRRLLVQLEAIRAADFPAHAELIEYALVHARNVAGGVEAAPQQLKEIGSARLHKNFETLSSLLRDIQLQLLTAAEKAAEI